MKFTPTHAKQTALSDRERQALRYVGDGASIDMVLGRRLQKLGLVEKKGEGWIVTEQGHICLMFQSAR